MQYLGFDKPSFGFKTFGFGSIEFSPLELFTGGKQGVWLDSCDLTTMFQDAAGTIPVTANGDPVGLIKDKSGNGNHATQTLSAARPVYKETPFRLSVDKVDDALTINFIKRIIGTMTIASTTSIATYGVDIAVGDLLIDSKFFPHTNIVGITILEGELLEKDRLEIVKYYVAKGAVEKHTPNNIVKNYNNWLHLVRMPIIDTSLVTNASFGWFSCRNIDNFPALDFSNLDNGTYAWAYCNKLTNFPPNIFDNIKGGNFKDAFFDTKLNQASIDGILVSLVVSGVATGTRSFNQSGGSAPSAIGNAAIDTLRSRGWTIAVTGGY